jgi:hypothetical protein
VACEGIELSEPMAQQLRAKPGGQDLAVTIGDMTSTRVSGTFSLVYVVGNSIMNVTSQDEQAAVFVNSAAHLEAGGRFVIALVVPQLRKFPPGENARVFTLRPAHIGIETLDDVAGQIASSRHWMDVDGRLVKHSAPYRYIWPSELDLMALLAAFDWRTAGRDGIGRRSRPIVRATSRSTRRQAEPRRLGQPVAGVYERGVSRPGIDASVRAGPAEGSSTGTRMGRRLRGLRPTGQWRCPAAEGIAYGLWNELRLYRAVFGVHR